MSQYYAVINDKKLAWPARMLILVGMLHSHQPRKNSQVTLTQKNRNSATGSLSNSNPVGFRI